MNKFKSELVGILIGVFIGNRMGHKTTLNTAISQPPTSSIVNEYKTDIKRVKNKNGSKTDISTDPESINKLENKQPEKKRFNLFKRKNK